MTKRARLCKSCGRQDGEVKFSAKNSRYRRICDTCWSVRHAYAIKPAWDWADGLHKSLAMSIKLGSGKLDGDVSAGLTPGIFRALMSIQEQKCAFTQCSFLLPEKLERNQTLTRWEENLPEAERALVPKLVRISAHDEWCQGNVVFVSSGIYGLYTVLGSPMEFKKYAAWLSTLRHITVPSEDQLEQRLKELETARNVRR